MKLFVKIFKFRAYEICALGIIIEAVLLRLLIISQGWPHTDSDESTMGLMALHIANNGALPLVFYGQNYMGTLEAYPGSLFFHLFGPSLFSLRLSVILIFALFLASMYALTSLLYTKKLALITLALLSLGSGEILFRQLEAVGGSPEVSLFGSVLLLLAAWLAFSAREREPASLQPFIWKRIAMYGLWAYIAGVAIWSDPLVLPFVGMSGLLLLLFCRGELRKRTLGVMFLCLLLGLAPQIIYLIITPLNQNSLSLVGNGYHVQLSHTQAAIPPSFGLHIAGTVLVSIPVATGGSQLCSLSADSAWPLSSQSSAHVIQCTIVHGVWSIGLIALLALAIVLAAKCLLMLRQPLSAHLDQMELAEKRRETIRHTSRLALLGSAGGTLILYTIFPPSAITPWPSARYLVGLLIATPAILAPLWDIAHAIKHISVTSRRIIAAFRYVVLFIIGGAFLLGTVATFGQIPSVQAENQQQATFIQDLLHIGVTHIYSDYWTCDSIIFLSNERIICSVLDENLQPGLDRYLPYRTIVREDAHASYAFLIGSAQATLLAANTSIVGKHYRRYVFEQYVIYRPTT